MPIEPELKERPHPLLKYSYEIEMYWRQWLARWEESSLTYAERLGLINIAFDCCELTEEEKLERFKFLLEIADGYAAPILTNEEAAQSSLAIPRLHAEAGLVRQELAIAAMRQLIKHVFAMKDDTCSVRREPQYRRDSQMIVFCDDRLMREKLIWFFRPNPGLFDLRNLPWRNACLGDSELAALRKFVARMVDYIWGVQGRRGHSWGDELALEMEAQLPKLVGILAGTGRLRILLDPEYRVPHSVRLELAEIAFDALDPKPTFGLVKGHFEKLPKGAARDAVGVLLLRSSS